MRRGRSRSLRIFAEADHAQGRVARVPDAVRRQRRDDGHVAGTDPGGLGADVRLALAREHEQDLLGTVGVGGECIARVDLEQHRGEARAAVDTLERELDSDRAVGHLVEPDVVEVEGDHGDSFRCTAVCIGNIRVHCCVVK